MGKLAREMTEWIATVGYKYGYDWDNLPTDEEITKINKREVKMNITGFLAIGNGEICPYCLKDSENSIKTTEVFIMGKDKDLLGHLNEKHPKEFKEALGLDDE